MKNLIELKQTYGKIISKAADFYGLDEALLAGLIWQESRGEYTAKSKCGAFGLTQIMPATADNMDYDLSTPEKQIHSGADYLAWINKHFAKGDTVKLLAGYNAGVGRLKNEKWKKFKETRDYVKLVTQYAEEYKKLEA